MKRFDDKDKVVVEIFEKVAGDDGVIDAYELQNLLQLCFRREMGDYDFNLETCRSLLALYDVDMSCCIEFDEFYKLWRDLKIWYGVFKKYDIDRSFDMDKKELRQALAGIPDLHITVKTIEIYSKRFVNRESRVGLDDFLQIIARIKCLSRSFERQMLRSGSYGRNPKAMFTLDAYVEAALIS